MKDYSQSVYLIILQVIGIIVGFISTFYIAGNLDPSMFALIGVYSIICTISLVFSNTGIETYAIRNILELKKNNEINEIERLVTISVFGRLIISLIILVPLFMYSYFLAKYKFSENYLNLFLLMSFVSIFRSINDASNLLLKAFNKYLVSAISVYSINIFGKLIAIFLFIQYGFEYYLYTLFCLPVLINFYSFYHIKKYINLKLLFDFKLLLFYLKKSKNFIYASYSSYFFNHFDQLIISLLMKPESLGVFTLAKNIWMMLKNLIENIFDPLSQKLIGYKNDKNKLKLNFYKTLKIRNLLFFIAVLFFPLILMYMSDLLILFNIDNYENLNIFIITIYISSVIYLFVKVKLNFATLIYSSSYFFKITLFNSLFSLIFLFLFIKFNYIYVFLYIGLSYLAVYFYLNLLFKKYKFNSEN